MTPSKTIRISKEASRLLRHCAHELSGGLDAEGWADLDDVVATIVQNLNLPAEDKHDVRLVLESEGNQRHETSGDRIRAIYGHSGSLGVHYVARKPPTDLFHASPDVNLSAILDEGLMPRSRQYVHMSTNVDMAKRRAQHHRSSLAVLVVDAEAAVRESGIEFFSPDGEIWLAKHVPAKHIRIVSSSG
ncbi:putative RNA 2'-phosphotransferase [Rhodococcus triatomae]|uniref:Probable RNA 2'-phosphotransferase n=2 Tax=Rhodococcus triatomae TaxID=300028 RepID=A0A1G8S5Y5_9NOCA|nr:putative RNA 2'-phosphotransferase [Rhodococcus triatomae]